MKFDHRTLGLLGALAGASGCFASHTIPLPGERYQCQCRFTEELPEIETECELDSSGSLDCDTTVTAGIPPATRNFVAPIFPCAVFEGDPDDVCDAACADPTYFPSRMTVSGVRQGAGAYNGPGLCAEDGTPPREFFFPEAPVDAVRNGSVVASLSMLDMWIEGIGNTGPFNPVDGTPVAIQGGTCDGGASCDLSINSMRVEVPNGVTLDGNSVDSLVISLAGGAWNAAEADGLGNWRLLGTSAEDSSLPLEFFGSVAEEPVEGEFTWDRPPASPADGPGGVIDLDRFSPDPHIRFTGTIRDTVTLTDGTVLNAQVDVDLYVRFFSGAPVPRAMMTDVGMTTEPLTLDGSASYDSLGGPIVEYEWLAVRADEEALIARGIRAALHRAELQSLHDQGYLVCLRTHDSDGFFDMVCEGDKNFIGEPDLPGPTCPEVVTTPAATSRFAYAIEKAKLDKWIDQLGPVTWLIPSNAALDKIPAEEFDEMLSDPDAAAQFVLTHVLPGNHDWKAIVSGQAPLHKNLAGTKIDFPAQALEDYLLIPDYPCGKGEGTVHRIATPMTGALGN